MKNLIIILLLTSYSLTSNADKNCLELGFYNLTQPLKLDTIFFLKFSKENIWNQMFKYNSSLNLVLTLKNICHKSISLPEFRMDQPWQSNFTIFGQKIIDGDTIDMSMDIEYDYPRNVRDSPRRKFYTDFLPSRKIRIRRFTDPLGFNIDMPGLYRFRVRHTVGEDCYDNENCYSNWLYLRLE